MMNTAYANQHATSRKTPGFTNTRSVGGDPVIDEVVAAARDAQRVIDEWPGERLDALIEDLADTFRQELDYLAEAEAKATGIGNPRDKRHKLDLVLTGVVDSLRGVKTSGCVGTNSSGLTEYASPVGVVFGVVPMTNPVPNSLFKTILCIKTKNALIASYPRAAGELGHHTISLIRQSLRRHGAPERLIQDVPSPCSRERTQILMSHPGVDLILATGGSSLVKAAYSSGTPAYGVGPGNVPVVVRPSAKLPQAAADILEGKSYDNGIVCGSESNILVGPATRATLIEALEAAGGAVLTEAEQLRASQTFFEEDSGRLRRNYIGVDAATLAEAIGVHRPRSISVLIAPVSLEQLSRWGKEKMTPLLALFTVAEEDQFPLAARMLLEDGASHTAVIHTESHADVMRFAEDTPAARLLVNTPATHGMLGVTTTIAPTFMMGCGSWGGNISTDGIYWRHLVNIKTLAYHRSRPQPSAKAGSEARA